MRFKNIKLIFRDGQAQSLSNLNFYPNASLMDVYDAIEDNEEPQDIVKAINKVHMVMNKWELDRVKDTYLRLKYTDKIGNVFYLIINF